MIDLEDPKGRSSCLSCGSDLQIKDTVIGRSRNSKMATSLCRKCRIELMLLLEKDLIEFTMDQLEKQADSDPELRADFDKIDEIRRRQAKG